MLYGDLAGFREYATARGITAPAAASDEAATQALQRGSDHIRYTYVQRLPSTVQTVEALPIIAEAAYLAAIKELETVNFFTSAYTPAEQKTLTRAGDISWTVTGRKDMRNSAQPLLTAVEAIFRPYLSESGSISAMAFST